MIFLLGKLPPPPGGVTVFNKRLLWNLSHKSDASLFSVSSISFKSIYSLFVFSTSSSLLVVSTTSFPAQLLAILVSLLKNSSSILILHLDAKFYLHTFLPFRLIQLYTLKKLSIVYSINAHSFEYLQRCGVYNTVLGSVFLPPTPHELFDQELSKCALQVSTLLEDNTDISFYDKPYILSGAWRPCYDNDNNEIYGVNSLIDAYISFLSIADDPPNLVISDPSGLFRKEFVSRHCNKFSQYVLSKIFFVMSPHQLWPLIKSASLFIRNTLTDGDSISIREALYFNVPVLATDVVPRPSGVTTCRCIDHNMLLSVWHEITSYHSPENELNTSDELNSLFPLYLLK